MTESRDQKDQKNPEVGGRRSEVGKTRETKKSGTLNV
jgi:hypothetical protein